MSLEYLVGSKSKHMLKTKKKDGLEKTELKMYSNREGREQKQEELQSCSQWNINHIHRKIDKMKRQRAMYQIK